MTVTFNDMREHLLSTDEARSRLAVTEPIGENTFKPRESNVRFNIAEDALDDLENLQDTDELADSSIRIGRQEVRLTKEALLECTSAIGLSRNFVGKCPPRLFTPQLDYFFQNRDREAKMLSINNVAVALVGPTIVPFPNTLILDTVLRKIADIHGVNPVTDCLVDYKFHHGLRRSDFRVIFPLEHNVRDDHGFCAGVNIRNSLTGQVPLSASAYTFDYLCTNGQISVIHRSGNYSRRHSQGPNEAIEWLQESVDEILQSFESEFAALDRLAASDLEGDTSTILADVFDHYKVPLSARSGTIDRMLDNGDDTLLGLMRAITEGANTADSAEQEERIMTIGGEITMHPEKCASCRRLIHT